MADSKAEPDDEESRQERTTRRWNEMLQELRVAQTGVQVLTGFLLTVPFSQRFADLDNVQRTAYLVVVSSSILAAGLLIAPVAFHRVLFGRDEKEWLVEAANGSARAGLMALGATMSGVVFLVFDVVLGRTASVIATSVTVLVLALLWLVLPIVGAEVDSDDGLRREH
jgi:Family of unknown function (DUF6328)